MNKRRVIGYLSIAIGLFLLLIKPVYTITGFAVSNTYSGFYLLYPIFSVILIFGGLFLLSIHGRKIAREYLEDKLILPEDFGKKIEHIEPDKEKATLVLDASAVLDYTREGVTDLMRGLAQYNEIFVPDSVLDQIRDPFVRRIVESKSKPVKGYMRYRKIAEGLLNKTDKAKLYDFLMPYLEGEKVPETLGEQQRINEETAKIRKMMRYEGMDFETAQRFPKIAMGQIRNYLERHCQTSKEDVDVLAYALKLARDRNHAIIGEKDIDFEQAVKLIKGRYKKIGKNIDCANIYRR
jgi:hypothetical protein